MAGKLLEIAENVEIDDGIAIPCPDVRFEMKKAKSCTLCPFYGGVGIMSQDESLAWEERFVIRCSHIIERRTVRIRE